MKQYSTYIILAVLAILLLYSRFAGLNWGLPYPFHPDERNMADAVVQLKCDRLIASECYNPHFFAYGQLPLYTSYIAIQLYHLTLSGNVHPTTFIEAIYALRMLSALSSIVSMFLLAGIVSLLWFKKYNWHLIMSRPSLWAVFLIGIFSPFFIQFAHFGTTESLLMMFYLGLFYLAISYWYNHISYKNFFTMSAIIVGLALATKVSAALFIGIPLAVLGWEAWKRKEEGLQFFNFIKFALIAGATGVVFSPFNIIAFNDFLGSMHYESGVGLGNITVFYTHQFEHTIPIIFQFLHIFPYALGWPLFLLFLLSFFILPFKKEYILLRLAFLFYFLPQAFFYAKWTRFMAPIFPMMTLIAVLGLFQLYKYVVKKFPALFTTVLFFAVIVITLPGIAYMSVYQHQDVRLEASKWMYEHINPNAYILSETANVVDLPIPAANTIPPPTNYANISFNFYELEANPSLQYELQNHVANADYIVVPSRRVFMNYTCERTHGSENTSIEMAKKCEYLSQENPILKEYYAKLFSGELGFKEVAEFSSYPKIELFGKKLIEIRDENAEETWTVFDHPVVRIYKRITQ